MRAAILIPHFNDERRLHRCLTALTPEVPKGVEVIVIDNGSTDSPAPMLAQDFPNVRLVVEAAPGAACARNRGVQETEARGLLFLDADCVPGSGWVAAGLAALAQNAVTGGPVEVFDEGESARTGAQAFEAVFAFDMKGYLDRDGFLGSGNLAVQRAAFDRVGPFRPGLSEDKDWSHRANAAGVPLTFDERLRVGHPSRGDWTALRGKWRRLTDEAWQLHQTEGRSAWAWAARAALMPASVLVHAPRVFRSPKLTTWDERFAAFGTLLRLRLVRMGWMLAQAMRA